MAAGTEPGARRGARALERTRKRRHPLRRALPAIVALAAVLSLILAVDPRAIGATMRRFDVILVAPLLGLGVLFYALQGLRWHLLLRGVGIRQRLADSEMLNLAGQTVTAALPLGDLTRALLASEASGVDFGAAAATVTVQELTFTLLLILVAAPALIVLPHGPLLAGIVLGGVLTVVAILTVPRVFGLVDRAVHRTPGLRRLAGQVEELQHGVVHLLSRPVVVLGSLIDLGRVLVATTGMWLILGGLHTVTLSWWDAALVLAVSYVGGALSLLPGGVGANEASVVAVMAVLGVSPANATAAALLQRLSLLVPALAGGVPAYLVVRRRFDLGSHGGLRGLTRGRARRQDEEHLEVRGHAGNGGAGAAARPAGSGASRRT